MTKVLFSNLFLYPSKIGGAEQFVRNLLKGFYENGQSQNIDLLLNSEVSKEDFPNFHKQYWNLSANRSLYEYFLPLVKSTKEYGAVYFPNYVSTNRLLSKGVVSTIHDIQFRHFPEYFTKKKRVFQNFMIKNTLESSEKVICISDFVKQDILRVYGQKYEEKLEVIYNPIDFDKWDNLLDSVNSSSVVPNDKYILSVAAQWPNKNILNLIKAYKQIKSDLSGKKLLLIGQFGKNLMGNVSSKYVGQIEEEIKGEKDIITTGFVSDEDLAFAYKNAEFMVFPSFFEGFGMPVAEGMGLGKVVLSSRLTSLEEVSKGKAVYFDDPFSPDDIAEKILSTNNNLEELKTHFEKEKEGIRASYNLQKIAEEYWNTFEDVAKSN